MHTQRRNNPQTRKAQSQFMAMMHQIAQEVQAMPRVVEYRPEEVQTAEVEFCLEYDVFADRD